MATVSKWFDYNYYMASKLAQVQKTDATMSMGKIVAAFEAAGFAGADGAERHFLAYGQNEELAPNAFFNATEYYRAKAADAYDKDPKTVTDLDVANVKLAFDKAGMSAWSHYKLFGTGEGVNPSNEFNSDAYMQAKVDVLNAIKDGKQYTVDTLKAEFQKMGLSALEHFMTYGGAAGEPAGLTADGKIPAAFAVPENQKVNGGGGGSDGEHYALTANADNIIGTSGNDIVTGVNNAQQTTFSAVDSIDGGAGYDEIKLELDAPYAGGVKIKNVEKISVTMTTNSTPPATSAAVNLNGVEGLKDVAINAGIATSFTNLENIVNAQISNTGTVSTLLFKEAAVAGSADKVTVTLNNVTGAAALNIDSASALGAGVEEVALVTTGLNSSVTLASNDGTISKVSISGDKNLSLALNTNVDATATAIDASALSGNLVVSGLGAANHTVTGGKGNDTFNFGVNFNANDTVDGGSGDDTLAITTSAAQTSITSAMWAKVKNIETVSFSQSLATTGDDLVQDASLLTGISNWVVTGSVLANENYTFGNVGADNTFTVVGAGQTAEALNITLKDTSGFADVVTVKLGAAADTAAGGVTLTALANPAGVETVNITSFGANSTVVNTITTVHASGRLVLTGDASLALGAVNTASQIDAGGLKGNFNLGGTTAYAINGGNVLSGAGNDTLVGGANSQIFNGGAGNDRLVGGAGADRLTGGADIDTFGSVSGNFAVAGQGVASSTQSVSGATPIANGHTFTFGNGVDTVTDFISGTDKLDVVTADVAPTSGIGSAANAVLASNTIYTLLGTWNAVTGVFTVDSSATASTANVAMLVAAGDGTDTFLDSDGYVLLTGVSSLAAGDFV